MNQSFELLYYTAPAPFWEAALPLGNGRLGAMVPGGVIKDTIYLNEDTLWSGLPDMSYNPEFLANFPRARELALQGRYSDADFVIANYLGDHDNESYLPAGTLELAFSHAGQVTDYRRELDLSRAVTRVSYSVDGVKFEREAFASFPAGVVVLRFTASAMAKISLSFRLNSPLPGTATIAKKTATFSGHAFYHDRRDTIREFATDGKTTGMPYVMVCKAVNQGGKVSCADGVVKISEADSVTLVIDVRTGFKNYHTQPKDNNLLAKAESNIDQAIALGYDRLLADHIADYTELYDRSILTLPSDDDDLLPTDIRLENCNSGRKVPPALVALLYHYGRYLCVASSRVGTQPGNLQGIWNQRIDPPWACNYTTNINTEMNYWHAEVANLSECAEPLFRFIAEVAEKGEFFAKKLYNLPGWVCHHNSDVWRFCTTAGGQAKWLFFPVCGGWLCRHLLEHYRYSGDKKFLQRYYPIIRGCAEFLHGLLVEKDGVLLTAPSSSPENLFVEPGTGKFSGVSVGTIMDMSIISELFSGVLEAAKALGEKDDKLLKQIKLALPKLKKPNIGSEGQLLEFSGNFEEEDIHHRHVSHLYGVYPGEEFRFDYNREYFDAAKVSLLRRGDKSTGWAMGWRVALWARFLDGNHACRILRQLLTPVKPKANEDYQGGGVYPNLFDAHPPFQIDGNFGAAAGIAEMLLQSHRKNAKGNVIVDILPALPTAWKKFGKISGLRARGGLTLDISWQHGQVAVHVVATNGGTFEINCGDKSVSKTFRKGEEATLAF